MNKLSIKDYEPKSCDQFFFDNNIWIFIFYPIGNYDKQKQSLYSSFFNSIISNGACIFINSLILSEFCNRCLRYNFDLWRKKQSINVEYKKDYLPTKDYKENAEIISGLIKKILKTSCVEKMPDDFNSIDLDIVLNQLQTIDFNDSYYSEYCKNGSFKLVTDDQDFLKIKPAGLTVVSL